MSGQRIALTFLVTFLFVSAINVEAFGCSRATQCPAFRLGSILPSHSTKDQLPAQSGYHMESQKSRYEERIVGGQETTPNVFPFMVYIETIYFNGNVAKCGGTLISDRWILTAAHCILGAVKVVVTLGAHDVTPGSTDQHQVTYTLEGVDAQAINYPGWYIGKVEDDISLIKLPQDVTLNQWIQPARLPSFDDPNQVGDSVVMTGWGNFSSAPNSGTSPTLRQVVTTVIPYTTCQQTAGVGTFTDEKIICGDGTQGRRYCYGDDGGPMIHYRVDEQQWFVIGVAWFGDQEATCQSSAKPNLYARVSNYVNWIYNETGIPTEFSCKNKENGLYPVPDLTCTKYFYYCSEGTTYLYDCPVAGTIFYYYFCACAYSGCVPGCNGYTGEPEMTTRANNFKDFR